MESEHEFFVGHMDHVDANFFFDDHRIVSCYHQQRNEKAGALKRFGNRYFG
jgi:hypothetical protein